MKKIIGFCIFVLLSLLIWLSLPMVVFAIEETLVEINIFYSDNSLKTSAVLDALDISGEILLPLSEISETLNLDIDLDRASGLFTVTNRDNNGSCTLSANSYGNLSELTNKSPVVLENELFVHIIFLEKLLGATSNYDPSQLAVKIVLNQAPPAQEIEIADDVIDSPEIKPFEAPLKKFSFSALEYNLEQTFRKNTTQTKGDFFLHFRSGLAEITTGVGVESTDFTSLQFNRPFFRLKLEKDNCLLLIGNYNIDSETYLKTREFFGVTVISPFPSICSSSPCAELELSGKKGETLIVLVNDQPVRYVELIDDKPVLVTVQLQPYRLQEISVIKDQTQAYVDTKNGLKLMPQTKTQTYFYYGLYAKHDNKWQGEILEFRNSTGLSNKTTLNTSLLWLAPDYKLQNPLLKLECLSELFYGISIVPVVYVCPETDLGTEIYLIASLPTGHWQLNYFNLPLEVSYYYPKNNGQGLDFFVEADLTRALNMQIQTQALLKSNLRPLLRSYNTTIRFKTLKPFTTYTLGLGHQENFLEPMKTIVYNNHLLLGYSFRGTNVNLKNVYKLNHLTMESNTWNKQTLDTNIDLNITPKLQLSVESSLIEDNKTKLTGRIDGDLYYSVKKNTKFISQVSYDYVLKPDAAIKNQNMRVSYHFQIKKPSFKLEVQNNKGDKGDFWLLSGSVSVLWPTNRLNANIGFKFPKDKEVDNHWKISWDNNLTNGLNFKIALEKLLKTATSPDNEYLATISLSQGLSWANNRLIGHRYSGEDMPAGVYGVVFLDLDGNGIQDANEMGIEGIDIRLGYQRIKTKKDGSFAFTNVEPSTYNFGFDPKKLVADYSAPVLGFPVKVKAGDNLVFDMPLTMNGVLKGRVFIDIDGNGIFSDGDEVVDWVKVIVLEKNITSFSDKEGRFYLENLPLGSFTLTVDEKSLPAFIRVPKPVTITITPEKLDHIIDIPLQY